MSRAGMIGLLLLVGVIGFAIGSTLLIETHVCEVCIQYHGRSQCREVGGATVKEARSAAIQNACAFLSSGVTDTMACARTLPTSEKCR